jgi:hypothetical protein
VRIGLGVLWLLLCVGCVPSANGCPQRRGPEPLLSTLGTEAGIRSSGFVQRIDKLKLVD